MDSSHWAIAYSSVIGNSHIQENIPCQDSCLLDFENGYGIAIVCDGAGSHQNSHIGSKQVCAFTHYQFRQLIEKHKLVEKQEVPSKDEWEDIALEALFNIKTDLLNFSIQENIEFKSLSCTVICTVFFPYGLLVAHIGDGRGGYLKDGKWNSLFVPFRGEFANETVFITSQIWEKDLIGKYISTNIIGFPVDAFCLLSDGCEKASFEVNLYDEEKAVYYDPNSPFPNFFNPNVEALKKLKEDGKTQDEINELWSSFLTNGNNKFVLETDDKTMILAVQLFGNQHKSD
jgi:Protein phosphatase 2C